MAQQSHSQQLSIDALEGEISNRYEQARISSRFVVSPENRARAAGKAEAFGIVLELLEATGDGDQ